MISDWPRVGSAPALLALLIVALNVGCNGPTGPTPQDRAALYTGRWSGDINGTQVVFDIQARWASGPLHRLLHFDGSGTALNPATGETHRLAIEGNEGSSGVPTSFFIHILREIGPGGVVLSGGQRTGTFSGNMWADGRTWPGLFTSTTETHPAIGAPIFGPGVHSVTLIKQ